MNSVLGFGDLDSIFQIEDLTWVLMFYLIYY